MREVSLVVESCQDKFFKSTQKSIEPRVILMKTTLLLFLKKCRISVSVVKSVSEIWLTILQIAWIFKSGAEFYSTSETHIGKTISKT